MNHHQFSIELCKTKAGYEATLPKPTPLNVDALRKHYTVREDAGIILVIHVDDEDVIVHQYGKLIFKTLTDNKKITQLAMKIYETATA